MNAPIPHKPYRPLPLIRTAFLGALISLPPAILSGCAQQHYYIKGRLDVVISDSPFPVPPPLPQVPQCP